MNYCMKRISMILGVVALLLMHALAFGANYPLEIIQPQPNLTNANRYYKTFTGFEYRVRVGAIGGLYPYTYSLTSAPSGMTIDEATGIIAWANPIEEGSPHNITVSITDSEGTTARRSWTLTVSRNGFYFLDAVNGRTVAQGGVGTLDSPWKTLADLLEAGTVSSGTQAFFKNGTYNMDGLSQTGSNGWQRHEVGATKPLIWLAYPGHTPIIDFGSNSYSVIKPCLRFSNNDAYIAGFTINNPWNFAFQRFGDRGVIAWNTFSNLRNGYDGWNSAFIMTVSSNTVGEWDYGYIHNNAFYNVFVNPTSPGGAFLKHYSDNKLLIEENIFSNQNGSNTSAQEGISLKAYVQRATVRKNTIDYIMDHSIGGSANINNSNTIEFNLVRNCGTGEGVVVNEFGTVTIAEHYYRNTFVCPVTIKNTSAGDGPFTFTNNVIVNTNTARAGLTYSNVSDISRIVRINDLTGTPSAGIVSTTGALQGSYRTSYLGRRGYETGAELVSPSPPSELRILP